MPSASPHSLVSNASDAVRRELDRRVDHALWLFESDVLDRIDALARFGEDLVEQAADPGVARRELRVLLDAVDEACRDLADAAAAVGNHDVLDAVRAARVDLLVDGL